MYSPPLLFEGSISERDGDKIYNTCGTAGKILKSNSSIIVVIIAIYCLQLISFKLYGLCDLIIDL